MYEDLIARLRKMSKISAGLSVLLPKAGGDAMAELLEEAADALEKEGNLTAKRSQPMPQSPGYETIFGYPIRDLVIFVDACRVAQVGPKELKEFVGNVEAAYSVVAKSMDECLARSMEDCLRQTLHYGEEVGEK